MSCFTSFRSSNMKNYSDILFKHTGLLSSKNIHIYHAMGNIANQNAGKPEP